MNMSSSFGIDDLVRVMETEHAWWAYRKFMHQEGLIRKDNEDGTYLVEFPDAEYGTIEVVIYKDDLHIVTESGIHWNEWAERQYNAMVEDHQ